VDRLLAIAYVSLRARARAWPLWVVVGLVVSAGSVHARPIPIVTIGDAGPDQEIPTDRSFYVRGDAPEGMHYAQAVVVRRGSPSLFGGDGPACSELIADLDIDRARSSATDDGDGAGDADDDIAVALPRYAAGVHEAFELFPAALAASRRASVLVSVPWQRQSDERQFSVLVPFDRSFFSAGYGYCLAVIATERAQLVEDSALERRIDKLASAFIACGDRASCDDDALAEYEVAIARALATPSPGHSLRQLSELASLAREAARAELASTTGLVEALARMNDRFYSKTRIMPPVPTDGWADTTTDPFAHAVSLLLARSGALLPQVRAGGVSLHTLDGKLQVKAVQLLDDGLTLRVAASRAPAADQMRELTRTTDALQIADGLTLHDLVQLGNRRIRVDKDWITLEELGDGVAQLGSAAWTADDATFLAAATAQLRRLANFVDLTTSGVTCTPRKYPAERLAEQVDDAVRRALGDWLACVKADAAGLEMMREQLATLSAEDQAWKAAKDRVVQRTRRILTVTSTSTTRLRASFKSPTWAFSYLTPIVGYAGILRPDESFGLFYVGAQIHIDPNPVDDVLWRDGITTKDLRRAIALELGLAPSRSQFGPDMRYGGPGRLPPLFVGAAVHVLPYTSLTFGGAIATRRNSTLREEQPHTMFAPYVGFTVQLNIPDLIRSAAGPSSETTAIR
jgi:hypothetical protein